MTYTLQLETPVGPVTLTATGEAVTQIRFGTAVPEGSAAVPETAATPLLLKAAAQLREYFAGTRRDFSLPLPRPTPGGVSKGGGLTSVPRPRERVSKGRGPQPSPFVSLGVQGEVETPWCFSSRVWGGFFSRKECAPRPCGGNRPLRE